MSDVEIPEESLDGNDQEKIVEFLAVLRFWMLEF